MKSRTILITGASGGIGEELAHLAAQDGHTLVLVARSHDKLLSLKQQREAQYSCQIFVFAYDLSHKDSVHALLMDLDDHHIVIDTLINNAGYGLSGPFTDNNYNDISTMMMLNMHTVIELTYKLLPGIRRHRGHILNVASTAAFQPLPWMSVYAATKAFVHHRSRALNFEEKAVSVTTFCPGPTNTGFAQRANMNKKKLFANAMDVRDVAKQGYNAMRDKKDLIVPGRHNKLLTELTSLLPVSRQLALADKLLRG